MSGYIGTTPRKMIRGWIQIKKDEEVVDYIETKDDSFSTNPIKDYYELVDNSYVKTEDFYQNQSTGEWEGTMNPLKTYYEVHRYTKKNYERRVIDKAWVGDENGVPKLALERVDQYTQECEEGGLPADNPVASVVYNNRLHILDGTEHYSFDGTSWREESTLPITFFGSAVVYKNKIHIFYLKDHYSWDGTTWTKASEYPSTWAGGNIRVYRRSAVVYNNKIYIVLNTYETYPQINGKNLLSWNGTSWSDSAPGYNRSTYTCTDPILSVYDNKIYLCGLLQGGTGGYSYIGCFDGSSWTYSIYQNDQRHVFTGTDTVVWDDSLYFIGGSKYNSNTPEPGTYTDKYLGNGVSLPYLDNEFYGGTVVVYNNKIHVLGGNLGKKISSSYNYTYYTGGNRLHFVFDGSDWKLIKNNQNAIIESPLNRCEGAAVVYNNKIHVLGGYANIEDENNILTMLESHYSYDFETITKEADIPFKIIPGSSFYTETQVSKNKHIMACVFNNKIYVTPTTKGLYSFNGSSWTTELNGGSSDSSEYGILLDYNNKLHKVGNTKLYSWNGTSWDEESTLPYVFGNGYNKFGAAVVYNNKIHILGAGSYSEEYPDTYRRHYSWDGTTWSDESLMSYYLNGADWPIYFSSGEAVVLDNKIHLLGAFQDGGTIYSESDYYYTNKHYSWNGSKWKLETDLENRFINGAAVVYNNKICLLGGNRTKYKTEYSTPPSYLFK